MANAQGAGSGGGKKNKPIWEHTTNKNITDKAKQIKDDGKPSKGVQTFNKVVSKTGDVLKALVTGKPVPGFEKNFGSNKTQPKQGTTAYDKMKAIESAGKTQTKTKTNTSSTTNNKSKSPSTTTTTKTKSPTTTSNSNTKSKTTTAPSYKTDKNGRPIYNGTKTSREAQDKWDKTHAKSPSTTQNKTKTTTSTSTKTQPKSGSNTSKTTTTPTGNTRQQNLENYKTKILDSIKRNSDAFLKGQQAEFGKLKDNSLADIERAWIENQQMAETDTRHTREDYDDNVGVINKNAYDQSQLTNLMAYDSGIQNSQQMLGLMAGDNSRKNTMIQGAMTERDRRIADINDRLSRIGEQRGIDIGRVNSDYGYNIAGARAKADQMFNEGQSNFMQGDYANKYADFNQDERDARLRGWDVEDRNLKREWDLADQARSEKFARSMAKYSQPVGNPNAVNKSVAGLGSQYSKFKQAQSTSPMNAYNSQFINKGQPGSPRVVNPYPLGAPPTLKQNPNLSPWEKMRIIEGKPYLAK